MNLESHTQSPTITKIYKDYEDARWKGKGPRLGAASIGKKCLRASWLGFRWAWSSKFDGRLLRLFGYGHRGEDHMIAELRKAGCEVWDRDPDNPKKQISLEAFGGHFVCKPDGVIKGLAEAPKTPHALEIKGMNDKNFKKWKAKGVAISHPHYYPQCQIEMHLLNLDRCYFFVENKNTSELWAERLEYNKAEAIKLMSRAETAIFSPKPPARISEDPSSFDCKICDLFAVCQGCKIPEVTCRSCVHATPERKGGWSCRLGHDATAPCKDHLFIPDMMPKDLVVEDAGDDWVSYIDQDTGEEIRNAGNSQELHDSRRKREATIT